MRGLIFYVLMLVLGAVLGIGLEKGAALLPLDVTNALTHVYGIGVHPLAVRISLCGLLGLIAAYFILAKFLRK
ncbi:MAG: hypothetical protein J6V32_04875 [Elusimicrobiaceae bacterium]|nr:hypothetical protein [Elusimicrobiaceae bacterium]